MEYYDVAQEVAPLGVLAGVILLLVRKMIEQHTQPTPPAHPPVAAHSSPLGLHAQATIPTPPTPPATLQALQLLAQLVPSVDRLIAMRESDRLKIAAIETKLTTLAAIEAKLDTLLERFP